MDISDKIIYLRKKNHMSQAALAEKIGVSVEMVSEWEKAALRPDVECIRRLSREFGIQKYALTDDSVDLKNNSFKEFKKTLNDIAARNNRQVLIAALVFLAVAFVLVLAAVGMKSILYSIFAIISAGLATTAFVLREKNK